MTWRWIVLTVTDALFTYLLINLLTITVIHLDFSLIDCHSKNKITGIRGYIFFDFLDWKMICLYVCVCVQACVRACVCVWCTHKRKTHWYTQTQTHCCSSLLFIRIFIHNSKFFQSSTHTVQRLSTTPAIIILSTFFYLS